MWFGKQVIPYKKAPSPFVGKEAFLREGLSIRPPCGGIYARLDFLLDNSLYYI